jgi:hypothetical protein
MLFVVWVPLLLQLAVPLGLLLWLAFGRPRNVVSWLARVILVTCSVVAISAAEMWLVLPWYTPLIYGLALFLAIVHSLPRHTLPRAPGEPAPAQPPQRPGTADAPLSGSPLPIRFGDRYPVRNTRMKV